MSDDGNPAFVDVAPLFLEPRDDRADVLGVVVDRRRFAASAALSDAALVEADHDEARTDEILGDLSQHRNAGDEAIAVAAR